MLMLSFPVIGFLYFHFWLIWNNYTTIEYCEKRKMKLQTYKESPFNKGRLQNFKDALGHSPWLWFVPWKYRKPDDAGLYH